MFPLHSQDGQVIMQDIGHSHATGCAASQAELFVLTPLGPRLAEPARRQRLIDKRNHLLKLSNNLAQPVDPELTLEQVQYAPRPASSRIASLQSLPVFCRAVMGKMWMRMPKKGCLSCMWPSHNGWDLLCQC